MESSEEADHDLASVDVKVRIRRFNEENEQLKEELGRYEETISTLEREIKVARTALYVYRLYLKCENNV